MSEIIRLSLAHMGGGEQKYIQEAFETNWIVPLGPNVDAFEEELAHYLGGGKHVVALSSGTAALHLALVLLGVGRGDEVICQSFTFAASANPIVYTGAEPVFIDSERDTWNMSPLLLAEAIVERKKATGKYPKAIIPVDLYGMPAKMDEINEVARRYGIPVIEDAAEALGSEYRKSRCGTLGDFGVLSFNGNKIITTSGGGALVCNTKKEAERVKFFATQARENKPYYYHNHIGYNYRLSNVCAGIGRGQMEVLERRAARRREIHSMYAEGLGGLDGVTVKRAESADYDSNYWLTCITVDPERSGLTADGIRRILEKADIESRLLWMPMHLQPVFADCPFYGDGTSDDLFRHGLCLPSGSILTDGQIEKVIDTIRNILS